MPDEEDQEHWRENTSRLQVMEHDEFLQRITRPLSYEDVVAWLEEKWGSDRDCPYCGNDVWYVNPQSLNLRLHEENTGGGFLPGKAVPLISVACSNCAQTVFLNEIPILAQRNAAHRDEEKK
jgi:hypothetical protein